jgi:hypothetical protein
MAGAAITAPALPRPHRPRRAAPAPASRVARQIAASATRRSGMSGSGRRRRTLSFTGVARRAIWTPAAPATVGTPLGPPCVVEIAAELTAP